MFCCWIPSPYSYKWLWTYAGDKILSQRRIRIYTGVGPRPITTLGNVGLDLVGCESGDLPCTPMYGHLVDVKFTSISLGIWPCFTPVSPESREPELFVCALPIFFGDISDVLFSKPSSSRKKPTVGSWTPQPFAALSCSAHLRGSFVCSFTGVKVFVLAFSVSVFVSPFSSLKFGGRWQISESRQPLSGLFAIYLLHPLGCILPT